MVSIRGRRLRLTLIAGSLLILAGLRDLLAPGFLHFGTGIQIDATDKLLAGVLLMALGLLQRMRLRQNLN
jgi:hypothetical protein